MSNDIIVLDDFLPNYLQDKLEELCYNIPWALGKNSTYSDPVDIKTKESKYIDGEQFTYNFWMNPEINKGFNTSPLDFNQIQDLGHYFLIPLQMAGAMNGMKFGLKSNFFRGKVNLQTRGNTPSPTTQPPHRDVEGGNLDSNFLKNNVWSIVYYVNDSEGDTIIYNEREKLRDFSKYTIKKKISPKKGRIVFMRGDLFHSASNLSFNGSKRIVINYNLIF